MTTKYLVEQDIFTVIHIGENLEREIVTPYCCDLLSIAMSKAPANSAWITVIGNVNTVAVGVLADVACIILAEGAVLDDMALEKAKMQNMTVLRSEKPVFDTALAVYELMHD